MLTVATSFPCRFCLPCLPWTLPRFKRLQLGLSILSVRSRPQRPLLTLRLTIENLVLVSIGISTILGLGVFYWENIKHAKERSLHIAKNACKYALQSTLDLQISSKNINSGEKMESKAS